MSVCIQVGNFKTAYRASVNNQIANICGQKKKLKRHPKTIKPATIVVDSLNLKHILQLRTLDNSGF